MPLRTLLVLVTIPGLAALSAAESVVLVDGGVAQFQFALPDQPDEMEIKALEELEVYLARLAGVEALERGPETPLTIEIGAAADNDALRERAAADPSGFFIEVTPAVIRLAGATPTATLYAAYELLERLGCRWFMPGEIGEVVPRVGRVQIATTAEVELPDFTGRILQALPREEASDEWALRNKLGGPHYPGSHSWARLVREDEYFETHPEYFSLVDGERTPKQLCTSNPEVIRIAAQSIIDRHAADPSVNWYGIGPNDGAGYCECPDCLAQDTGDWDPFANRISITDRFLRFANAVAEQVHEVYPEIKFAFYVYSNHMRPPLEVMPDPSMIPAIAPIHLCRLHGMANPVCPERNYHQALIRDWTRICPEVYHRGYSYNLAGPNLPLNYVSRWAYEIPYCKRAGITGFRIETQMSWANYGPLGYVLAQLMWDADQDVQLLLEDYYDKFYGPAANPMQEYWTRMDRERRDAPCHTGNAVNIPDIYTPPVMKYLAERIALASKRAADTQPYAERVHIAAQSLAYLDAFLTMRAAAESFNFIEAKRALDGMRAVGQWMHDYQPRLVGAGGGVARIDRFWASEVEQAHERTTGGNSLVYAFPDEWRVYLDPLDVGEDLEYFARRLDDSSWQTLRTYSASWSDQGLRYYKGVMWYRHSLTLEPRWAGRRLMLWFGGIDEDAKVWVNDTYIGEFDTNGWQPVEIDITHAIRYERENLVCVKVTNAVVNELGCGGITRPVMIWSPAREQPQADEQPEEQQAEQQE